MIAPPASAAPAAPRLAFSPGSPVPLVFARVFAERSAFNVHQWAEANITLRKTASANSGPYRLARTPHTRFLQELFTTPGVRRITVKKSDQAAITESILNFIRYCVAESPRNILYVIDSANEAKRIARTRLEPSLQDCPVTRQHISAEDEAELQTLTFYLRDMTLYFAGGSSIGAIANKPVSVVIIDEADKIPRITGGHTHVAEEAESRMKAAAADEQLFILLSKPNLETDVTTVAFRRGSQHRAFLPCPHCGHLQEFVQERLRFDHCRLPGGDFDLARVLAETHYLCAQAGTPACPDGRILDAHRTAMLARIEWRPHNPNPEPGHISLEISDFLLDPGYFPDVAFGRIALDLIDGFKNPAKMKAVQARRFGKEELLQRAELKEDDILRLRSHYLRGTAPRGLVWCGIYSDLQGYGPKWLKFGFNRAGELFCLDWGTHLAIDDLLATAAEPIPELDESQPFFPPDSRTGTPARFAPTGRSLVPSHGWIDEGDEQKHVLSFCVRSGFFFLPTKGRGGYQIRGSLVTESPRDHDGAAFVAYHFNDDQFKKDLYLHRIRDHEKIVAGKKRGVARLHVPVDVDAQFCAELTSEHLKLERDTRGFTVEKWEKQGPNDFGDCVKGALVAWHVMGPRILAELDARARPVDTAPAKAG